MSQGIRDMLANKKFAMPLLVLLGFCLVGLILVGVVLILRPGAGDAGAPTKVGGEAITPSITAVALVTFTPAPSYTATPRPSPTLVPVAPAAEGDEGTPAATADVGSSAGSPTAAATAAQATATTASTDSDGELAETGLGWGLILFAGTGLAGLAVAARRLRLSGG
jgi:hypothetical protein